MPGYDQSGPRGAGPLTGGGFGNCTGSRPVGGRRGGGMGAGRGNGAGRCAGRQRAGRRSGGGRWWNNAPVAPDPQDADGGEIVRLRIQARQLAAELQAVESRLAAVGETAPPAVDPPPDTTGR